MLKIKRSMLPCDEATLRASLVQYKQALMDHPKTIGVPAPWPDYDILPLLVAGGGFEVVEDDAPLPANEKPLSLEDKIAFFETRIQSHLDFCARKKGYDNIASAISYKGDDNATWSAEGVAFAKWRSAVWQQAQILLANFKNGSIPEPTWTDVLAQLPQAPYA